jgi:hypothetical protein
VVRIRLDRQDRRAPVVKAKGQSRLSGVGAHIEENARSRRQEANSREVRLMGATGDSARRRVFREPPGDRTARIKMVSRGDARPALGAKRLCVPEGDAVDGCSGDAETRR